MMECKQSPYIQQSNPLFFAENPSQSLNIYFHQGRKQPSFQMESEETAQQPAVKAKEAAIGKMRNGNFHGALELALEAKKLCPGMESIDQMILVCSVHSSAADGKDWYRILDVAATADEAAVKQRCGRMAIALHPDENHFPGAAEAFQLIVEAKAVLLDKEKRRVYDSTCRASAMGEEWGFGFSRFRNHEVSNGFAKFRNDGESTKGFAGFIDSFEKRADDYSEVEISDFGVSRFMYDVQQHNYHESSSSLFNTTSKGFHWEICDGAQNQANGSRGRGRGRGGGRGRGRGRGSKPKVATAKDLDGNEVVPLKRGRGRPPGSGRGRGRGRGSSKTVEVLGDNEGVIGCSATKKLKRDGASSEEARESDDNSKRAAASATLVRPDSEILEYREAEYNDFEQERCKTCFKAGQVWAVYDTIDAMPRFYAMINAVTDDHMLRITWLEPLPNDEDEKKWLYQGLPVCFGKFKNGCTETIQDYSVFSHLVNWKRDAVFKKNYDIRPLKGETWAVFKNWDIKWDRFGGLEYEVVEILSDYYSELGVNVAFLGKIEGTCSVFGKKVGGVDWKVMGVKDRLRFSHRIPSFSVSLNGESFFELDPASLPPPICG